MSTHTSVLIVGGGLNGLTAAALLSRQGIRCMVIERHPDTSIQYKFAGISPRSMEVFRSLGLEAEIRAKRTGGGIARAKNLADPDILWGGPAWPDASPYSPTQPATCDQHVLEPILRHCSEQLVRTYDSTPSLSRLSRTNRRSGPVFVTWQAARKRRSLPTI